MRPEEIAVLGGVDPIAIDATAEALERAARALRDGRNVRFTVEGGLKIAIGGRVLVPPMGSHRERLRALTTTYTDRRQDHDDRGARGHGAGMDTGTW